MVQTRDYWLTKKFSDPKRYPYGIGRSGDFTISQSQQLEQHGAFINALLNDAVADPNEDDIQLKQAIAGGNANFSPLSQVWLKYVSTHHEKISVSSSAKVIDSDDDEIVDSEDWIDDED